MPESSLKVKICGLMTAQDCRIANQYRPDYAGFVFADTRHKVSDGTAAALRQALDPSIPAAGVFVDDDPRHIAALVRAGTIQMVQLHGQEDAAYIAKLRELIMETVQDRRWRVGDTACGATAFQGIPFIRAVRLSASGDRPEAEEKSGAAGKTGADAAVSQALSCDYLLLDTWDKGVPGGSGRRFDLSLIPAGLTKPWFLAGGLTPDNVAEVLRETRAAIAKTGGAMPFAVDVSSGVESACAGGHKDEVKVARFLEAARSGF